VPNLRLFAWDPIANSRVGASRRADITTDESGRFRFSTREAVVFLETAPGSPVKFICPSHPFSGGDLYVVEASWSGDRAPGQTLSGFGSIQGKVTELVGALVQPAVGATVTLLDGGHMPPTVTNASGFYAICSPMGSDFLVSVSAHKDGYRPATSTILWGWDFTVNFTLERN
jgi:hypothetical protein